jgi:DinB superfamily
MNIHYAQHLSELTLDSAIRELETAVRQFPTRDLEIQASASRGEGKWTRQQLLGHLIDSALNNIQRFVRAQIPSHLEGGKLVLPGYAQNDWIAVNAYDARDWSDLAQLWKALNLQIAHVMRHASPSSLQTSCIIGGGEAMPLEAVMIDYVGHLKHHLEQIEEGVA